GGRWPVRVDLGPDRAGRLPDPEQARARVARQVRRARPARRLATQGHARAPRRRARVGTEASGGQARRPGLDLRSRRRRRARRRAEASPAGAAAARGAVAEIEDRALADELVRLMLL